MTDYMWAAFWIGFILWIGCTTFYIIKHLTRGDRR